MVAIVYFILFHSLFLLFLGLYFFDLLIKVKRLGKMEPLLKPSFQKPLIVAEVVIQWK